MIVSLWIECTCGARHERTEGFSIVPQLIIDHDNKQRLALTVSVNCDTCGRAHREEVPEINGVFIMKEIGQ